MTTQPAPTLHRDPYYVWSNGTDGGSWGLVNQGTNSECEAFVADRMSPALFVQQPGVKYLVLPDGREPAQETAVHQLHGHAQYPAWCQLCRHDKAEAEAIGEQEHEDEIRYWVDALDTASVQALKQINAALDAIARLTSNEVYDIEFAEGVAGSDVRTELENAGLSIRHVRRIVSDRKDDLAQ